MFLKISNFIINQVKWSPKESVDYNVMLQLLLYCRKKIVGIYVWTCVFKFIRKETDLQDKCCVIMTIEGECSKYGKVLVDNENNFTILHDNFNHS